MPLRALLCYASASQVVEFLQELRAAPRRSTNGPIFVTGPAATRDSLGLQPWSRIALGIRRATAAALRSEKSDRGFSYRPSKNGVAIANQSGDVLCESQWLKNIEAFFSGLSREPEGGLAGSAGRLPGAVSLKQRERRLNVGGGDLTLRLVIRGTAGTPLNSAGSAVSSEP